MKITEVRVKLMEEPGERLKAFCSITFDDCFVVRDLKIIEGANGPFVAMPSRKLTAHCPSCRAKNHLRAAYCNQCSARLRENQAAKDDDGRAKLYADIAHPINSNCREMIQLCVIEAFDEEMVKAQQPNYVSTYEDFDPDDPAKEPKAQSEPKPQPKVESRPDPEPEPKREPEEPPSVEPKEIQQAEPPRGPHQASPRRQNRPSERPRKGDFGAGIFE